MIRGVLIDPDGVLFFPEDGAEGLQPDARLTLGCLQRRGYRLGLVAEGSIRDQADRLVTTCLTQFWDTTLITGEHGAAAMDHTFFNCALDCLDLRAEETVFVSAGVARGFAAARQVGLATFWVGQAGLQPPPHTLFHLGRFWELTGALDLFEGLRAAS